MTLPPSLVQEHWLIRRALNALEAFAGGLGDVSNRTKQDLKRFATFFRVFGDEHHAEKEEEILLPILARAGTDWQEGPLARARREHRQERYFMRVLKQLAEQEEEFDAATIRRLQSELQAFVESMRGHLQMEDEAVFPLIQQLSEDERTKLDEALERFDTSAQSAEMLPVQRRIADELIERYRFLSSERV